MIDQHPLMTFALFAYNQERFIREAVGGALAQTYSPLQVILSDDFSSDRTFEIMQKMVVDYSGPHEILLNRNERNLGIGGHVNRIMELAKGELIIVAAGDDISLPHRTAKIYAAWLSENMQPSSICSSIILIDAEGKIIEGGDSWARSVSTTQLTKREEILRNFIKTRQPYAFGCSHAWHKKVFKIFGPLPSNLISEDNAISFRSLLLNGIKFIDEPLVIYRTHDANISNRQRNKLETITNLVKEYEERKIDLSRQIVLYNSLLNDLQTAHEKRLLEDSTYERLWRQTLVTRDILDLQLAFELGSLINRVLIITRLIQVGVKPSLIKYLTLRMLPKKIYIRTQLLKRKIVAQLNW